MTRNSIARHFARICKICLLAELLTWIILYWVQLGDGHGWVWLGVKQTVTQEVVEFTHLFSLQVEKARNDELKHWENDPKATLALIILQDQFLRSLYKVCARGEQGKFSNAIN